MSAAKKPTDDKATEDKATEEQAVEENAGVTTEIAEPDKEGGALRYRGVDIKDLVGRVSFLVAE